MNVSLLCQQPHPPVSLLGLKNALFDCMQISRFFSAFETEGRAAGVWSSGFRPSNKKPQALNAQIIDVNLQVTLLHNEHFRKSLGLPPFPPPLFF